MKIYVIYKINQEEEIKGVLPCFATLLGSFSKAAVIIMLQIVYKSANQDEDPYQVQFAGLQGSRWTHQQVAAAWDLISTELQAQIDIFQFPVPPFFFKKHKIRTQFHECTITFSH